MCALAWFSKTEWPPSSIYKFILKSMRSIALMGISFCVHKTKSYINYRKAKLSETN